MRQATCTLSDGGVIDISGAGYRRTIVGGDVVDLDQVLTPATKATDDAPATPAFTLADALGHHVDDDFDLGKSKRGASRPSVAASDVPAHQE